MTDNVADRRQPDPTAPHPTQALDDVVHHRTRLGILAVLLEVDRAEFGYLRDVLGLSDGNLSRHLRTLEAAGHIRVRKGYQGKRSWPLDRRRSAGVVAPGLSAVADLELSGRRDSRQGLPERAWTSSAAHQRHSAWAARSRTSRWGASWSSPAMMRPSMAGRR
jgi:DNA-binding transcriptional ArsR family regulator